MYFVLKKLCEEIENETKILIYGAGHYAIEIYKKFCVIGWKDRIKKFVVTSIGKQSEYIEGIPVVEFDRRILDEDKYIILVAVGKDYAEEIKCILSGISPGSVFYLWDYAGFMDKKKEALLNSSFDILCNNALDEYIWRNPQYLNDKRKLVENLDELQQKHNNLQVKDKSIVYIMEEETARDIKIIRALIESGYEVDVLQYALRVRYAAEKELLNLDIVPERFTCVWEFIVKSLNYRPNLYFFDVETTFDYVFLAIHYREIWGRVVIAPYETFIGSFVNISEEIFEKEKFCLENADAVVWRYFSKEYLENKMGYRFKGESVHLLDNCGGYELSNRFNECSNGKLRLCCVVSQIECFLCEDSSSYTRQAKFTDILEKVGGSCELDIYAWCASTEEEEQLAQMKKKYKNFNFFYKVEHKDLIHRLSAYDYGLCIYTNEEIPTYPIGAEIVSRGTLTCTEGTYRHSVANRYFDYIDAELPIITTLPEKLCEYLQQYDVIIRMNIGNLDVDYLKRNREYYKKKAKIAKKELLMSKHINILTDMFERINSKKDTF